MRLLKLYLWFRISSRKFEKASRALKVVFQRPWTSKKKSRFSSRWRAFFLKKKLIWRLRNPPRKLKLRKSFKIWLTIWGKVRVTWPMKISNSSMWHCSLWTRIKIWLDNFFCLFTGTNANVVLFWLSVSKENLIYFNVLQIRETMERIKYELYGIRPRVVNFSGETSKVLNSPEPKPGRFEKIVI